MAQVLIDGLMAAAELLALLFVAPAAAVEPPAALQHAVSNVERMRELRALTGKSEVFRLHRAERAVGLLAAGEGCGGGEGDATILAAGHAELTADEAIADAWQLASDKAPIGTIARQPLGAAETGGLLRLALPAYLAAESHAILVDQHNAPLIVVIAGRAARGVAHLTLRPDGSAASKIELGQLADGGSAFVIPLANRAALVALVAGAIEFEARANDSVLWSTLPVELRTDASFAWIPAE